MIYTDSKILEEIENGNIYIDPFDPSCVGTNSYDVHLSPYLAVMPCVTHIVRDHDRRIITIEGDPLGTIDPSKEIELVHFEIPKIGFRLVPGVLYLGSTLEYTQTRGAVPKLEGKSSVGRLGIEVHKTAGFGDINFFGHWTLEIEVTHPTLVFPGMPIGQICYQGTNYKVNRPYNEKKDAKYSHQEKRPVASKMYKNLKNGRWNNF